MVNLRRPGSDELGQCAETVLPGRRESQPRQKRLSTPSRAGRQLHGPSSYVLGAHDGAQRPSGLVVLRGGTQQVKDIAAPLLHRQDRREPPFALLQVDRKLPQVCLLPPHAQAIVLQLERDAQRLSEATGSFVLVVGFGDDGAYLTGGPD